ncbi:TIGR01244 family sulfur transferase [Paracoccus luteus]|uniref:TIGR01244 family sulfur transferase n=1 Tax=Paracoccus luteus TaxID=2508543 RepID=UPI00106FC182|nr:TIGR01244 family sulfur transferase [Paracoccus luteus]
MDLRQLTPDLAVSPQIEVADVAALAQAGFRVLIDNRPDAEIGPDLASARMAEAAAASGLTFHYLPFQPAGISPDLIQGFDAAVGDARGPVIAYCRSGTRCATLWALTQAGRQPAETILATAAGAGYDLAHIAPLLRGRG